MLQAWTTRPSTKTDKIGLRRARKAQQGGLEYFTWNAHGADDESRVHRQDLCGQCELERAENRSFMDQSRMHLNSDGGCTCYSAGPEGTLYVSTPGQPHPEERERATRQRSTMQDGAVMTNRDQCMYGVTRKVEMEELSVRRATTLMSNLRSERY